MDEVKTAPRRTYRSAVRTEGAARTRQEITAAATRLFLTRGYASSALADIAVEAGVARPTVFAAFGSKAALLKQVIDEALAGDDEPQPVADRPWFRPVWDAATPAEVARGYADVCTLIGRRAAPLFEVARRAADASPETAELWQTLQDNRRAGATMVAEHAHAIAHRRPSPRRLARTIDQLWLLNDPAHYSALVGECGWTEQQFRTWLTERMREAIED